MFKLSILSGRRRMISMMTLNPHMKEREHSLRICTHGNLDITLLSVVLFLLRNTPSKASSIISRHNKSEPLFLYLAFQSPHMNLEQPPDQYHVGPPSHTRADS